MTGIYPPARIRLHISWLSPMMTRLATTMIMMLSLSGCAGDLYLQGAESLDEADVARIIKPKEDSLGFFYRITTVQFVNGRHTGYKLNEIDIAVPPGEYTLDVLYKAKSKAFSARKAFGEVEFIAVAGRRYKVESEEADGSVSFWVVDVLSGERVSDISESEVKEYSDASFTT